MTASALTLTTLRARLQALLVDAAAVTWSTDTLDESIRQALDGIAQAVGTRPTLSGLDGAAATTLDVLDDMMIIRGAAGYAAHSRVLARAEMTNLAPGAPDLLNTWAEGKLSDFRVDLERARKRGLHHSTAAPGVELPWDESVKNW